MANKIPDEFLQLLLARVDILDIIGGQVSLRKAGGNYVGICPFHKEKTPSFSVNADKQFYHCFGCNMHGDAIQFLIEYEQLSFIEAVETLAAKAGLDMPPRGRDDGQQAQVKRQRVDTHIRFMQGVAKYYVEQLNNNELARPARNYINARNLSAGVVEKFQIGFALPTWNDIAGKYVHHQEKLQVAKETGMVVERDGRCYDRFRNRIMFPIKDQRGRVVAFGGRVLDDTMPKYLNSPETTLFHKGKLLYGLFEAKQAERNLPGLLVVEGYLDVISLHQAGIYSVVATLGTALTDVHIELLFKVVSKIVVCFDGDKAGKQAAIRAMETFLPHLLSGRQVRFLFLPAGEDPDSYVQTAGRAAFLQLVARATPLPDFLFSNLLSKVNIEHIEGRSMLAEQAIKLLKLVPKGIFSSMMFNKLSELTGLDINLLRKPPNRTNKGKRIKTMPPPRSPAVLALAYLLRDRSLIKHLVDFPIADYINLHLHGIVLFCHVVRSLRDDPHQSPAVLRANLPPELAKCLVIEELSAITAMVPAAGIEQEFLGAVEKVKSFRCEEMTEVLLKKSKLGALSLKDKLLLQELLQRKVI